MVDVTPQTCKVGTFKELESTEGFYIAQEKLDGHRACMHIGTEFNRIMLRGFSKKTGQRDEATDKLPHLRDFDLHTLTGTILDGELVFGDDSHFFEVQRVIGATPENAIAFQEENGYLTYKVFDIIYYNGKEVKSLPLIERLKLLDNIRYMFSEHIKIVPIYFIENCKTQGAIFELTQDIRKPTKSFADLLTFFWSCGKEGLVLKDIFAPYVEKRSGNFLKYKSTKTADLVIMGFEPPSSLYSGKLSDEELLLKWKYWETTSFGTRVPVTKSYYNKWVGGVTCGAYKDGKLVYVCTASNLSDELKAEIKEKGKDSYIGKVVEIQYQNSLISKDGRVVTLINPRFIRFREDKSAKECLQGDIT